MIGLGDLLAKAKHKLRDVRLHEISLVKKPAADDARIALFKREEEPIPMTDAKLPKAAEDAVRALVAEELSKAMSGEAVSKTISDSLSAALRDLRADAADDQVRKESAILAEAGRLADQLVEKSGLKVSKHQAMAKIWTSHPGLYSEYKAARGRRFRDPRYCD